MHESFFIFFANELVPEPMRWARMRVCGTDVHMGAREECNRLDKPVRASVQYGCAGVRQQLLMQCSSCALLALQSAWSKGVLWL